MSKTKKCGTCKKYKFLEEFNKNSYSADGRQWNCRDCDRAHQRRRYREKPEWFYERDARRRAVEADAFHDDHTMAELSESWNERDFYGCYWCGADLADGFHIDHVIPISKGGDHTVHNLVPACPECNLSKGAKLPIIEWSPPNE